MSRVFLAEEIRLGRRVVVKVLSPVLAPEVSADRFEREIKLAARLQEPLLDPLKGEPGFRRMLSEAGMRICDPAYGAGPGAR
jgi:serine/threonine protein kinase